MNHLCCNRNDRVTSPSSSSMYYYSGSAQTKTLLVTPWALTEECPLLSPSKQKVEVGHPNQKEDESEPDDEAIEVPIKIVREIAIQTEDVYLIQN